MKPKIGLSIGFVIVFAAAIFEAPDPIALGEFAPVISAKEKKPFSPPPSGLIMPHKLPALDLLSMSQPGKTDPQASKQLLFDSGPLMQLRLSWLMRTANVRAPRVRLDIGNEWVSVQSIYPIQTDNWKIGGAYAGDYDVNITPFSFGGHGVLRVWLCDGTGNDEIDVEVGRVPCWAGPIVSESPLEESALKSAFGENAKRLGKACRLFPGLDFTLPIDKDAQSKYTGIAVVSALRFSPDFVPGQDVLEVVTTGAEGSETRSVLKAGVHTSVGEYNAPRPGTLKIPQVEIFSVSPYTGATWNGKPVELTRYIGRLPLLQKTAPSSVHVRYLAQTGAIDVYDIVLLFDRESLAIPAGH